MDLFESRSGRKPTPLHGKAARKRPGGNPPRVFENAEDSGESSRRQPRQCPNTRPSGLMPALQQGRSSAAEGVVLQSRYTLSFSHKLRPMRSWAIASPTAKKPTFPNGVDRERLRDLAGPLSKPSAYADDPSQLAASAYGTSSEPAECPGWALSRISGSARPGDPT